MIAMVLLAFWVAPTAIRPETETRALEVWYSQDFRDESLPELNRGALREFIRQRLAETKFDALVKDQPSPQELELPTEAHLKVRVEMSCVTPVVLVTWEELVHPEDDPQVSVLAETWKARWQDADRSWNSLQVLQNLERLLKEFASAYKSPTWRQDRSSAKKIKR